jgi:hypothetical protein
MINPMKWFKIPKPVDPAKQFIGRFIIAYPTSKDAWRRSNGVKLEIETIRGNLTHQTMFEINGSHLVSMLDAYCTLNGEPLPNQEMHEGFLSTVAEQVTRESDLISAQPKRPTLNG